MGLVIWDLFNLGLVIFLGTDELFLRNEHVFHNIIYLISLKENMLPSEML